MKLCRLSVNGASYQKLSNAYFVEHEFSIKRTYIILSKLNDLTTLKLLNWISWTNL